MTLTPIAEGGAVTTFFYDLSIARREFEHPSFRLRGQRSNPYRHRKISELPNAYKWLPSKVYKLNILMTPTWYLHDNDDDNRRGGAAG